MQIICTGWHLWWGNQLESLTCLSRGFDFPGSKTSAKRCYALMLAFSSSHHRELMVHLRAANCKGIDFLLYLLHFLVVGFDTAGLATKIPEF